MKKIAPGALVVPKDALSCIYHYLRDFQSFVTQAVDEPEILSRLNWKDLKRNNANLLVELLARNEHKYQPVLLRLMSEVARMDDFSHLERLDDGKDKADRARRAVAALRKLIRPHEDEIREQEKARQRQEAAAKAVRHAQVCTKSSRNSERSFSTS